ncbi:uncharacterized protein LOC107265335 [Cephus cinctus]|uniref:Uncharacterized protein LOC107265335 n=1 Tax=Cephus cinctus TaxID=211228 RepID=A0AAJ7FG56_CEPCN|nr:uncharacterized protein LOC107265335 [Cephus cinctus]
MTMCPATSGRVCRNNSSDASVPACSPRVTDAFYIRILYPVKKVEMQCRSGSTILPIAASLLMLALGPARSSMTPASSILCPCPTNEPILPSASPAAASSASASASASLSAQAAPATANSDDMTTGWNWSWHWSRKALLVRGVPCFCDLGARPIRDDYVYTPGIGSHKLHTRALVWNEARKMCNEEGGHLAIVNSLAEAHVLVEIFNASGPVKGASYTNVAYLGVHDLYKEGEWVTILGESLARTGYTKWSDKWGGQPDNGQGKQHCGVFMNEGGLDDVACDVPFAFFCELPDFQVPR